MIQYNFPVPCSPRFNCVKKSKSFPFRESRVQKGCLLFVQNSRYVGYRGKWLIYSGVYCFVSSWIYHACEMSRCQVLWPTKNCTPKTEWLNKPLKHGQVCKQFFLLTSCINIYWADSSCWPLKNRQKQYKFVLLGFDLYQNILDLLFRFLIKIIIMYFMPNMI